ncbi:hypothetical protein [Nocardioides currus]|uniref:Uncharacterized protein n=1 Tax=Nocardioides currus TaxID=2133958 RepID=A0A2R7YWI1_9ACTN|nr:hypothetical protein [Nocardioides currus]PUA80735.1 hypothetical protein C7S10_13385 [Nocardioides currus]
MTTKGRDDVATVIERTLQGGPRVLHIALDASTVPVRLAQEHDREVECLRWPVEPEEPWGPDVGRDTVDDWAQPFLVAPVDVVVVEDVLDDSRDADQFFRTLGTGPLVPGALVVVSGVRDLTGPITSSGFVLESDAAVALDERRHITVARFPSFTTARPQSPEADEASAAEVRRLAHELERTRELLARERATIAREMQSGKDELLAMDRQINDLQERLQRLRHKNVLLRARVAQVSRERDLSHTQVAALEQDLFLARDSRAVRAVASVVERARRRKDGA